MSDQLDPNKYHVFTSENKRALLIVLTIFVVLLPILFYFYYSLSINRPSQTDREITIRINKGEGISEIAAKLGDEGAVNSEFLFSTYVLLNKDDTSIQAGVFVIPAGTSIVELTEILQHGTDDVKITYLEGWRIEEFAKVASESFENVDYKGFILKAAGYEGRLYPDTYLLNREIQEDDLVAYLNAAFEEKVEKQITSSALNKVGLTEDEVIILASIVEREVPTLEDKGMVADILIRRYKEGMKLDIDATTQYAVSISRLCDYKEGVQLSTKCSPENDLLKAHTWWPTDLTQEELTRENPYNTRAVAGLPPAPISSFSIDTLNAVLNPTPNNYVYYLHDSDGVIHYAETLEGHNANVSKYLR